MLLIAINKHGVSLIHPVTKVAYESSEQIAMVLIHFLLCLAGYTRNASLYAHLELVIGQYVFPHDNRQFGAWLEAAVRNIAGL